MNTFVYPITAGELTRKFDSVDPMKCIARTEFWCCGTCGHHVMHRYPVGTHYAFCHEQNMTDAFGEERHTFSRQVHVQWGVVQPDDREELRYHEWTDPVEAGQRIKAALEETGLAVEWPDEDPGKTMIVRGIFHETEH